MSEQLTIKNLYNHMDETIAKDIFEGATYPWEILPKISGFIKELGRPFRQMNTIRSAKTFGSQIRNRIPDSLHPRTGDHRKERRSPSLCIYPRKCDRRRRCSRRKFDRT